MTLADIAWIACAITLAIYADRSRPRPRQGTNARPTTSAIRRCTTSWSAAAPKPTRAARANSGKPATTLIKEKHMTDQWWTNSDVECIAREFASWFNGGSSGHEHTWQEHAEDAKKLLSGLTHKVLLAKAEALDEYAATIVTHESDPDTDTRIFDPWDVAEMLRARAAEVRGGGDRG